MTGHAPSAAHRGLALVALGLLAAPTSRAAADDGGQASLTLSQAIARAVAGNVDLRRERASVARARAAETAALGQFDLRLEGGLALERERTPSVCGDGDCVDLNAGTATTVTANVAVSRNLETGGSLALGAFGSRAAYGSDYELAKGLSMYTSALSLSFTHPLLRGLGTEVTQANLRKARIQIDIAQLGRHMRACNVVRDVVIAYWELAYATRDLAIRRSAVELAQEQLRITDAKIRAGRLADADAASVERAIAHRQEDLALAEQSVAFRSFDLLRLFGEPVRRRAPATPAADVPSGSTLAVDEDNEVERALAANPQLRALRLGLRLSETDLAVARNTLMPRLDLRAAIGPVGRNLRLGRMADDLFTGGDVGASAGLTFELPVQNRVARGRVGASEEELRLATLNAEDFALQVEDVVVRTIRRIQTAQKRVALGERETGFAQQNLDAERARFEAGRATNNDVLLRQQELKDAEQRLLRASVDLAQAEAMLAAVTAEILDQYGVSLHGP